MLKLELVPGKGLGEFLLGMPISEAISVIQQNIDHISLAELKFNEHDPLAMDLVLDLVESGLQLKFEAASQRLRIIEIYDVPKVTLSYSGSVFSSAEVPPTFVIIYSRFGPSYPGDYNSSKNLYRLHYPNLSFTFPIPAKFQSLYSNGTELPVEFPDGTTPITTRIYIYSGSSLQSPLIPPQPASSLYFEPIVAVLDTGILTFSRRATSLNFHSSAQEVLSELGPPSRIYYKEEDKMRIHSATSNGVVGGGYTDYFYNYFQLGMDFLFDASTHTVKKFIMHTNFPTHYEFNQYAKCNFRIRVSVEQAGRAVSVGVENPNKNIEKHMAKSADKSLEILLDDQSDTEEPPQSTTTEELLVLPFSSSSSSTSSSSLLSDANDVKERFPIHIEPDMKWPEVQAVFGQAGKPVVNNRGSSANPFGATYFFGYRDIIFEVMRNNHIASVCIFNNK